MDTMGIAVERGAQPGAPRDPELAADCTRCLALCCSLPFSRGRDFPEDKPGGRACRNLAGDYSYRIHDRLLDLGWQGCVSFDCFGAGQQVSQVTYGGLDDPAHAGERAAAFSVVRMLHEMRFILGDPACRASTYAGEARALDGELARIAALPAPDLLAVDVVALREAGPSGVHRRRRRAGRPRAPQRLPGGRPAGHRPHQCGPARRGPARRSS